jgi:hypothetical protein
MIEVHYAECQAPKSFIPIFKTIPKNKEEKKKVEKENQVWSPVKGIIFRLNLPYRWVILLLGCRNSGIGIEQKPSSGHYISEKSYSIQWGNHHRTTNNCIV